MLVNSGFRRRVAVAPVGKKCREAMAVGENAFVRGVPIQCRLEALRAAA